MPDTWEIENGLDLNDKTDALKKNLSPEGYTNIEVYINGLFGKNVTSRLVAKSRRIIPENNLSLEPRVINHP